MAAQILPLSNSQARELAGKAWCFDKITWTFKPLDTQNPGQLPWSAGSEGKAYPLLNSQGQVKVFIKFYNANVPRRRDRVRWLISRNIRNSMPQLMAAPALWVDSRKNCSRPMGIAFDLCGCIAAAAPGIPWLELKTEHLEQLKLVSSETRWKMVEELIHTLACLESQDIVHGDISPRNALVDLKQTNGKPLVYLIDFDAFESKALPQVCSLSLADGGTYGTDGYCPRDLVQRAENGDLTVRPYSDRFARDMMILEFLFAGHVDSTDQPPSQWNRGDLRLSFTSLLKRSPVRRAEVLKHLAIPSTFDLKEQERPSSLLLSKILRHHSSGSERIAAGQCANPEDPHRTLGRGIQSGITKRLCTIGMAICFLIGFPIFTNQNENPISMKSETSSDSLDIEKRKLHNSGSDGRAPLERENSNTWTIVNPLQLLNGQLLRHCLFRIRVREMSRTLLVAIALSHGDGV